MDINPRSWKFEILGAGNTTLKLPPYQRGYAWSKNQINDFFNDLELATKSKKSHFYGTIFTTVGEMPRLVLDGQQRITTAFLCFKCLMDRITSSEECSEIREILYTGDDLRLESNDINKTTFNQLMRNSRATPRNAGKRHPNYKLNFAYRELCKRSKRSSYPILTRQTKIANNRA